MGVTREQYDEGENSRAFVFLLPELKKKEDIPGEFFLQNRESELFFSHMLLSPILVHRAVFSLPYVTPLILSKSHMDGKGISVGLSLEFLCSEQGH